MSDNNQKNRARRCIGAAIFKMPQAIVLGCFLCAPGCSDQRAPGDQNSGAEKSSGAISSISTNAPALPSALNPASSSSAAPSASQSADAPQNPSFLGEWEGSYNAKKGSVELPSSVKDKVRSADDGKKAVGAGKVTLTISAEGELAGKLEGALGKASLRGKAEGTMVRASIFPDEPTDALAMTGVLVGVLKEGVIAGEIRVAGPDASVVRESLIELRKKDLK